MVKATRTTQCDRVLAYLKRHGTITDTEARDELHIRRLSGRIYDLKRKGIPITMHWEYGRNTYGEVVKYGVYTLAEEEH